MPSLFEAHQYPFEFAATRRRSGLPRHSPSDDDLHTVRRGVFLPRAQWEAMEHDDRYRAFVLATLSCSPTSPVLSHLSAAAFHRLPIIGSWPTTVHTVISERSGGRSSGLYNRHRTSHPPAEIIIEGVTCTSLERTIVDVARSGARASALAMADQAIAQGRTTIQSLLDEDAGLGTGRGSHQSRALISLASPLAANGGESFARLILHDAGFIAPRLQHRFDDADGLVGYTDFAWPDARVVLEFDGRQKYTAADYSAGRTAAEIVWAEKRREDRLRALGLVVVRAVWDDLIGPIPRLPELVDAAGINRRLQIGIEGAR